MAILASNDTICAVSTPAGSGGIAVVRVSGPQAVAIVGSLWRGADLSTAASHTAHLGYVLDNGGNAIDQVVATIFRAPHSYTGDDVVELSCHGSTWIQRQLLTTLTDAGCRLATAGEFTKRAFLNRRLDLSQAEAVADLIAAESAAAARVALSQLKGNFAKRLGELHDRLVHLVALLELELDFSEEDVEFADRTELLALADELQQEIDTLTASFSAGNAIKNGMPVAIVGQTNAGKSTILNALTGDDRAIVSEVHGTTRDTIEDVITLGDTLIRLIDTAGLRHTGDTVEAIGIKRAVARMEQARIVIWVIDATTDSATLTEVASMVVPRCADKQLLIVINKTDLATADNVLGAVRTLAPDADVITMSAHCSGDVTRLREHIARMATPAAALDGNAVVVTNARHHAELTLAGEALRRATAAIRNGISGELVAQDLREVMDHIGAITGTITTTAVLTDLFANFCIGK